MNARTVALAALIFPALAHAQISGSPSAGLGLPSAPVIVQEANTPPGGGCSASPSTVTFAATPGVGDLLFFMAGPAGGTVDAPPAGVGVLPGGLYTNSTGYGSDAAPAQFSVAQNSTTNVYQVQAYVREVQSGDGKAWAFTNGNGSALCVLGVEVSGAATARMEFMTTTPVTASQTLYGPAIRSDSGFPEQVYIFIYTFSTSTTITAPAGYTQFATLNSGNVLLFKRSSPIAPGTIDVPAWASTDWNGNGSTVWGVLNIVPHL